MVFVPADQYSADSMKIEVDYGNNVTLGAEGYAPDFVYYSESAAAQTADAEIFNFDGGNIKVNGDILFSDHTQAVSKSGFHSLIDLERRVYALEHPT